MRIYEYGSLKPIRPAEFGGSFNSTSFDLARIITRKRLSAIRTCCLIPERIMLYEKILANGNSIIAF